MWWKAQISPVSANRAANGRWYHWLSKPQIPSPRASIVGSAHIAKAAPVTAIAMPSWSERPPK